MSGYWMQTYSGRKLVINDPDPAEIDLEDIAHHLSRICRFQGATTEFYSVAQHSVLVSQLVPPEHALQALLHDAAEAYLGDLIYPVKRTIGAPYEDLEALFERAIAQRFGLPCLMTPEIKHADQVALATERRDVMSQTRHVWQTLPPPDRMMINPLPPDSAKRVFLDRAEELGGVAMSALPAPGTERPWREVLAFAADERVSMKDVRARYRALARALHPDLGGDREAWLRLLRAAEQAEQEVAG